VRNQLDIFDHDPARIAAGNRAAAERALHDVQFTAAVRQERHEYYVGEAERWEHLAATARAPPTARTCTHEQRRREIGTRAATKLQLVTARL
jgi:hypothetical protein